MIDFHIQLIQLTVYHQTQLIGDIFIVSSSISSIRTLSIEKIRVSSLNQYSIETLASILSLAIK